MTAPTFFPDFEATVGSQTLKSGGRTAIWRLEIQREVNGGADEAVLQLGISGSFSASPGDAVTVDLGYHGSLSRVFTGKVESVFQGLASVEVHALGSQAMLMRMRGNKGFVNQKAGEVLESLAREAGADVAQAEAGVALPFYLAEPGKNYWEHGLELGFHAGCDLYVNAQGEIVFAPIAGTAKPLTLKFGSDLLQAACENGPNPDKVIHVPESPAASSGEETAAWLTKDVTAHQGEEGDGDSVPRYFPVLRTQEQAQASAKSRHDRLRRAARLAEVELLGNADVELGDPVKLEGLPAGGDGKYVVLALRHALGLASGFRTYATLGAAP